VKQGEFMHLLMKVLLFYMFFRDVLGFGINFALIKRYNGIFEICEAMFAASEKVQNI